MSLKKTERYHGRIAPDTKARWVAQQKELGFGSLAAFIEDTIEQTHFPTSLGATGGDSPEPVAAPALSVLTPEGQPVPIKLKREVIPEAIEKAHQALDKRQLTVPGADLKVCPNLGKHRKGVFCKGCNKVIR